MMAPPFEQPRLSTREFSELRCELRVRWLRPARESLAAVMMSMFLTQRLVACQAWRKVCHLDFRHWTSACRCPEQ